MKEMKFKRLNGVDAYRTLMVYSVVLCHTNEFFYVSDVYYNLNVGVYGCFVLTGFLYGFYHWDDWESFRLRNSCNSAVKKMVKFYPLHFVAFLLDGVAIWRHWGITELFSKYQFSKIVTNLALVQSFVPRADYYFSYNGVSWYLSATLFLYFMAPLIVHLLRHMNGKYRLSSIFTLCVVCELIVAVLWGKTENAVWLVYINPINALYMLIIGIIWGRIRCCSQGDSDLEKKDALEVTRASVLLIIGGSVVLYLTMNLYVYDCMRSVLFGFVLYAITSDRLRISRLLSLRFWSFMASFSFEVFMFHQVIGKYMRRLHDKVSAPNTAFFAATILISMFVAYVWHVFEKKLRLYLRTVFLER